MLRDPNRQQVVVVGSIHLDHFLEVGVLPRPGETVRASGRRTSPGGKGANQAIAAAAHGVTVELIGAVGRDDAADTVLTAARERGVRVGGVVHQSLPTGRAIVAVDPHGENLILVDGGASAAVSASDVRAAAEIITAAAVVVLQGEIPAAAALAAAEMATGTVMLTPAPIEAMSPELLASADVLIPNRQEALRLAGEAGASALPGVGHERPMTLAEARQLLAKLLPATPVILLTLGAEGVLARVDGTITHVAAPLVDVVDTTGAGDAFAGAVAAGLALGRPLMDVVHAAVEYGASAVQHKGAVPPVLSAVLDQG